MRTTLTLEEDVAAKLKAETRRTGRSFKETVNEILRLGFNARQRPPPRSNVVGSVRFVGPPTVSLLQRP